MPNIRFDSVTYFQDDTKVMGATVSEWDKALTGNMAKTLREVQRLANTIPKRDITQATVFDVASSASKQFKLAKR